MIASLAARTSREAATGMAAMVDWADYRRIADAAAADPVPIAAGPMRSRVARMPAAVGCTDLDEVACA
jgi:hypothetical protein